jgi:hypothetical protein
MSSVDRVKSILQANSGPAKARVNAGRLQKLAPRPQARVTRRDGVRLAVATLLVAGALAGLYVFVGAQPVTKVTAVDTGEVERRNEAEIKAHRMGSILFLSPYQYCELHRFDNFTGNTVAIDYVDCEATAEKQITAETLATKAESMKGVLSSFKK